MKSETKKCPLCAEEIPFASVICEYCDAQFEVTSSGYCQTCHEVREADENGQCRVCDSAVVDLRVESKFVEESAQESLPVVQSVLQPEISRTGKSWLPIGILAGILILAVIVASLWFGRNSVPAISSPVVTNTPRATITSTPTFTPTAASTNTPRPTPTTTPLPAWVLDFAEPILSEIANRSPTIQDDMHDNSGGWHSDRNRTDYLGPIQLIDGELVLDNCDAYRSKMGFMDFVLEVDGRFTSKTNSNVKWKIVFRDQGPANPQYSIGINYDGNLDIGMHSESFYHQPLQVKGGLQNNHILLIAKGSAFALYANGQPLYYWQYTGINQRGTTNFRAATENTGRAIIALDNLKIWDISDMP